MGNGTKRSQWREMGGPRSEANSGSIGCDRIFPRFVVPHPDFGGVNGWATRRHAGRSPAVREPKRRVPLLLRHTVRFDVIYLGGATGALRPDGLASLPRASMMRSASRELSSSGNDLAYLATTSCAFHPSPSAAHCRPSRTTSAPL